MSEEKQRPPPRILHNAEIRRNRTPIIHSKDDSIEHEYTIEVSPDLPPVRLRVFLLANGDARVEAEFEQRS